MAWCRIFQVTLKIFVAVFQCPDVFAKFSLVAVFAVIEGLLVVSVSCFECVLCNTHICLISVLRCDCSLVDYVLLEAVVVQWAGLLFSAVAFFFFLCGGAFCFLLLDFFFVGQIKCGFEAWHAGV